MEDKILSSIENAISQLPRLSFEKIATPLVEKMENHDRITRQETGKKVIPLFAQLMPIVAVAAMAVFGWYNQFAMVNTIIQIDVNPSIEITLNKQEKVLKVRGLNPDGYAVIGEDGYKNLPLSKAVEQIVEDMAEQKYLGEDTDVILISADNQNREDRQRITQMVSDSLALCAAEKSISPHIYFQELYDDDYIEEQSEKMGISQGKMQLIQTLLEQDSTLELEELSGISLGELISLAKDRGLTLYLDRKPYPNLGINIDDFKGEDEELVGETVDEEIDSSKNEENEKEAEDLESSEAEESSQPTPESSVSSQPTPESSVSSQPTPESSVSSQQEADGSTGATPDGYTGATPDGYTGATPDGYTGATNRGGRN